MDLRPRGRGFEGSRVRGVAGSRGRGFEGSRVQGLLESASWSCVGAQVKDGSHVVIWTACK